MDFNVELQLLTKIHLKVLNHCKPFFDTFPILSLSFPSDLHLFLFAPSIFDLFHSCSRTVLTFWRAPHVFGRIVCAGVINFFSSFFFKFFLHHYLNFMVFNFQNNMNLFQLHLFSQNSSMHL